MRVSLETDPAEFVKQVADLRRFLNREDAKGGQAAMSARFLTAAYVPLLATLRTELKGKDIEPAQVMTAVSDLIGNIAMTLIQSMFDAPPEAQADALARIIGGGHAAGTRMIEADARLVRDQKAKATKPKLVIDNGGK